jgi:hypothetical protein
VEKCSLIYERNSNGKKRRSDIGPRMPKKSKPETFEIKSITFDSRDSSDKSVFALVFENQGARAATKNLPAILNVRQVTATVTKSCGRCTIGLRGEQSTALTVSGRDITTGNSNTVTGNYPASFGIQKITVICV